jgi:hypothetical protein
MQKIKCEEAGINLLVIMVGPELFIMNGMTCK